MNVYISHSSAYDYENELYRPIRESGLSDAHNFFLPHESQNLTVTARDELKQTDLLVAEVSYPSTGQGIELGLASASGVPIICFYKAGTKTSSSLRFVTDKITAYTSTDDLLAKLAALTSDTAAVAYKESTR